MSAQANTGLCIAAAQSASVPGDVEANVERHLRFVEAAHRAGASLLLFPELSLSGYEPALVSACALQPDDPRLAPLRAQAMACRMHLVVGAPLASGRARPFIGALLLRPDGTTATYAKHHLHPGEERFAVPGDAPGASHSISGETMALAICADASQPVHAEVAAASGASLYLAGSLISEAGYAADAAQLAQRAARHRFGVLLANHGAPSGGYACAGRSAFWAPGGECVAALPGLGAGLLLARRHAGAWSGDALPLAG
jgi:predicted amidohydrolase